MAITTVGKNYQGGRKMTPKMKKGDEVFKDVSEMDYSERREYIDKKYLPKLKDASFYFMIHETGFDYDMNGDRQEIKKRLLDYYRDNADYTESSLNEDTMYMVKDWDMFRKEIDPDTDEVIDEYELTEVSADNTYNFSYLGAMDLNWRVYHDEEYDKWFYVIHPHLGGDPRGNYGDALILEGDDKEDLFYRFYQGFISGSASISLTFNDDSSLTFYSEQDSDVYYFRHEIDEDSLDVNSVAREYLNDFNKFENWHGDEFLEETVNAFNSEKKIEKKALGGDAYDEEPRVYVQILGYPEGKWIELSDFSSGSDVIDHIQEMMEKLNNEKGGNREEYMFADYEGYGSNLYDEYMGESEFDEILESYDDYKNSDYPFSVVKEYIAYTQADSLSSALSDMNDKYYGSYDRLTDFAEQMVSEGLYTPTPSEMYVSDTDKRILSGEEADARVDNMDAYDIVELVGKEDEYDSEKSKLESEIDDLNDKISSLETYANNVEGYEYDTTMKEISELEEEIEQKQEIIDGLDEKYSAMYREDAVEIIYDEIYHKLDKDLESWLDDYGYGYSDYNDLPFLQVDYDAIAQDLENQYVIIEDGKFYVFLSYKNGGKVVRVGKAKKYPFYVVEITTKKIVGGFDHKEDASDNKKELTKNNPKLRFGLYKRENLMNKFDIKDCTSYSNWIDLRDLDKSSKVKIKKKDNHPLKSKRFDEGGQMVQQEVTDADFQMQPQPQPSRTQQVASHFGDMAYQQGQEDLQAMRDSLQKDSLKSRIKRGAKKIGEGASRLRQRWIDADFGDGTGKAKYFADGGVIEEIKTKYQIAGSDKNGVYTYSKIVADEIAEIYGGDVQEDGSKYYVTLGNKYSHGGRTGYKVLAELHTLKDKGVKNVSLNGFNESIGYVIDLNLDDSEIKKVGEMSYETNYKKGGMTDYKSDGGGVSDERTILEGKAIEFLMGTAIDYSSITHEGENIKFKYKHNNYRSSLSKKLIDNTIRFHLKSLEGRKSYEKGGSTTKYREGITTRMTDGGSLRKMDLGDAVIYKDKTWYIKDKDGVIGLMNLQSGAWGSDYPFVPISKINLDAEVRDMNGNKVSISEKYAGGGKLIKSTSRANNSPLIKSANFVDGSHINMMRLIKPYKSGESYAISESSIETGQKVRVYQTLEDAELRFDIMVENKSKHIELREPPKTFKNNYAKGGGVNSFKVGDYVSHSKGKSKDFGTITQINDKMAVVDFEEKGNTEVISLYDLKKTNNKYAKGGGVSKYVLKRDEEHYYQRGSNENNYRWVLSKKEATIFNDIEKAKEEADNSDADVFSFDEKQMYAKGGGVEKQDWYDFDKKMALINLDQIHEYAVKLDKIITEKTELEDWVKMKITRVEQNMVDVKKSLEGWEKFSEGGELVKKQLLHIAKYSKDLIDMIQKGSKLMSWQENKLAVSSDYIDNVYHHLDYQMGNRASDIKKMNAGGLSEVSDMLPSPLPMSTIQPMAYGGDVDFVEKVKMNDLCIATLIDFVNSITQVKDVFLDDTDHLIFFFNELPTVDILEDMNLFIQSEEVTGEVATCLNVFTGDVNYQASSPYIIRVGLVKDSKFTNLDFAEGGSVPNRDKMFELPLEMVVYVPSTQDVNKVISVDEMDARVDEVKNYLASKFGGYTSSDKIGGFVDSNGNLVNEEITQVVAFSTKEAFEDNKKELIQKLAKWGKKWGQEAIGFEFEGDLLYVPQADEMKQGGELWIQDAVAKMKENGTEGAFTRQAKRHGKTPVEFAKEVLKNPKNYRTTTLRRANFVRNTNPEKF